MGRASFAFAIILFGNFFYLAGNCCDDAEKKSEFLTHYLCKTKGIERNFVRKDLALVYEGGAEYIFPENKHDEPSFLCTGYVSYCVVVIIYSICKEHRFAYMAHMNEHNSWQDLFNSFDNAKNEYHERYGMALDPRFLKAVIVSGKNSLPTINWSKESPVEELAKLGIEANAINIDLYKTKNVSFHDIVFDGIGNNYDINCFEIIFSAEMKEKSYSSFYDGTEIEIWIDDYENFRMPLAQKLAQQFRLKGLSLDRDKRLEFILTSYVTPLIRCSTPSCNKCGKAGKTMRCSACKTLFYCGKTCQANDWPRHKGECQKLNQVPK